MSDNQLDIVVTNYSDKILYNPQTRKFVRQYRRAGIPTVRISPECYRKISQTRRASGVSAIVRQRWTGLKSISLDKGLCWVILGLIRSPGNLGTLTRKSEAVGGAGFILLDKSVDIYGPATVRACMGAHFRQEYTRTNVRTLQRWIQRSSGQVIGASPDGAENTHEIRFPQRMLMFLGEDRRGLAPEQRSMCDQLVRIPMVGQADSLNCGVAGSPLMYEIYRARNT